VRIRTGSDLKRGRSWLSAVVVVGLLLGAGHATAVPAAAGGGACTGTSGVTVVVDFTAFGRGVSVSCAPGSQSSGFDALTAAGFQFDQSANFPGAICRIKGFPGPGAEDCQNMPPPSAYWSYWHASRGGSWTYSTSGGSSSHPAQGTVDGWAFGSKAPPSLAPPALSATPTPRPTAKPTSVPTPRPTPTATQQPTTAPTSAATRSPKPGNPSTSAAPTASPLPSASTDAPSLDAPSPLDAAGASASSADSPDPSDIAAVDSRQPSVAASDLADPADPGAPPLGTIAGLVLVVALVAVGAVLARRRSAPDA